MGAMTGTEMFAAVLANLGNRATGDITAVTALPWFNWTMDHIASPRVYRHRELEDATSQLLVTNTADYTIAAATGIGTLAVSSAAIYDTANVTNRRRLTAIRPRDYHARIGTASAGEPCFYSWWAATQIHLFPVPDATHNGWTLSIWRIREPTRFVVGDLSAATVSIFSRAWDEVIVQGATWRGWRALREWERAEQAKRELGQLVNEVAERQEIEAEDVDFGPPILLSESM